MELSVAKSLLRAFQDQLCHNEPLHDKFVPALMGRSAVVVRDSWHGKVAGLLDRRNALVKQEIVGKAFFEALKSAPEELPDELRLELLRATWTDELLSQEVLDFAAPEVKEMGSAVQKKKEAERKEFEEAVKESLLHGKCLARPIDDLDEFMQLFKPKRGGIDVHAMQRFLDFLGRMENLKYASGLDVQEFLDGLDAREARLDACRKRAELGELPRSLDEEARALAHAMRERLKSGKEWTFCGTYGSKMQMIPELLRLVDAGLQMLPNQRKKWEGISNPEQFAQKKLHEVMQRVGARMDGAEQAFVQRWNNTPLANDLAGPLNRGVLQAMSLGMHAYFGVGKCMSALGPLGSALHWLREKHWLSERCNQEVCAKVLPELVQRATLKPALQLAYFSLFFLSPPELAQDLFLYIADNAHRLGDKDQRDAFLQDVEERVVAQVGDVSKTAYAWTNAQYNQMQEMLQETVGSVLPPEMLKFAGGNSLFAGLGQIGKSGPLWLRVLPEADGTCAVHVYALGSALEEGRGFPKIIEGVDPARLNEAFFRRLLYHDIETELNPEAQSDPKDIYEGLLGTLRGKERSSPSRQIDSNCTSEEGLLQQILLNDEYAERALFDFHRESLVAFCQKYLDKQGKLVLEEMRPVGSLESAIRTLEAEAKNVQMPPEERRAFEATLLELRAAIQEIKDKQLPIDQKVKQLLAQQLKKMGIAPDQMQGTKEILCWALGDEMAPILDELLDAVGKYQHEHLPGEPQKGWLMRLAHALFVHVMWGALHVLSRAHTHYMVGLSPLNIASVSHWALKHVLPHPLYDWYLAVLTAAKRMVADMVTNIVLHVLFSKEAREQLQLLRRTALAHVRHGADVLLEKERVSLALDPALVVEKATQAHYRISQPGIALGPLAQDESKRLERYRRRVETLSWGTSAASRFFDSGLSLSSHALSPTRDETIAKPHYPISELSSFLGVEPRPLSWQEQLSHSLVALKEAAEKESVNFDALVHAIDAVQSVRLEDFAQGWDDLRASEEMCELLSDVAIACTNAEGHRHTPVASRLVLANYKILAMMEMLARKHPEIGLGGFRVDATGLLHWLKSYHGVLPDAALSQEAQELCDYFFDGAVEITDLPRGTDIARKGRKGLFNYDGFEFHPVSEGVEQASISNYYRVREFDYLEARLNDPTIKEQLRALTDQEELSSEQELDLLFRESFVFTRQEPLLPRMYQLLRLQTLLARGSTRGNAFPDLKSQPAPRHSLKRRAKGFVERAVNKVNLRWRTVHIASEFVELMRASKPLDISEFDDLHNLLTESPRGQAAIIDRENASFRQQFGKDSDIEHLEMVRAEPRDEIVRALDFYQHHPDQLTLFEPPPSEAEGPRHALRLHALERVLFHPGALPQQLQESPTFAETLWKWTRAMLTHYRLHGNVEMALWTTHIGYKFKRFAQQYAPEYTGGFADLSKEVEALLPLCSPGSVDAAKAAVLRALCCDGDAVQVGEYLWKARQSLQSSAQEMQSIPVQKEDDHMLGFEMPRWASGSSARQNAFLEVLFDFEQLWAERQEDVQRWKRHAAQNGEDMRLLQLKRRLAHIAGTDALQRLDDTSFSTPDGRLVVAMTEDGSRARVSKWDETGKQYDLYSTKLWVESSNTEHKRCHEEGKEKSPFTLTPLERPGDYVLEDELYPLSAWDLHSRLGALARFYPVEEMEVFKDNAQPHIGKVRLPEANLEFKVRTIDGMLRAESVQYPGFFIAEDQHHPDVEGLPSYLLLENAHGAKKVLLSVQDVQDAALWSALRTVGPLASLFNEYGADLGTKTVHSFAYDCTPEGALVSDDPRAATHLIGAWLVQRKYDKALQAMAQMETLFKRIAVPKEVFQEDVQDLLFGLCCALPFSQADEIRRRLFALAEQSFSLHHEGTLTSTATEMDLWMCLRLAGDLSQLQKERVRAIGEDQEWLLFRTFFRRFDAVAARGATDYLPKRLANVVGGGRSGNGLCMSLMMQLCTPGFIERYRELDEKFAPGRKSNLQPFAIELANYFKADGISTFERYLPGFFSNVNPFASLAKKTPSGFAHLSKDVLSDLFDAYTLRLDPLKEGMDKEVGDVPLSLDALDAQTFKKHFLTYYGMARGDLPGKRMLQAFLPFIKGGWDKETKLLVEYLGLVARYPIAFLDVHAFKAALQEDEAWYAFFHSMAMRAIALRTTSHYAWPIAKEGVKTVIEWQAKAYTGAPALAGQAIGYLGRNAINRVMKAAPVIGNIVGGMFSPKASEDADDNAPTTSYAVLDGDDQTFDNLFKRLHKELFVKKREFLEMQKLAVREKGDDSSYAKARTERVRTDVAHYEEHRSHVRETYALRSQAVLWEPYVALKDLHTALSKQIAEEQAEFATCLQEYGMDASEASLERLTKPFLDGTLGSVCSWPQELAEQGELFVMRTLARTSRLKQIERMLGHLEAHISAASVREKEHALEHLSEEMRAGRSYTFAACDPELARIFVAYEARTGKLLWDKQIAFVRDLSAKGRMILKEALPSLGKTSVGMSTLDRLFANGKNLVINTWVRQMFQTNTRQLSQQNRTVFDQKMQALHIARDMVLTSDRLEIILAILKSSIFYGDAINMTRESAQSLELLLIDRLYDAAQNPGAQNAESKEVVRLLAEILALVRTSGINLVDEAHEQYYARDELNYPIGASTVISEGRYDAVEKVFSYLVKDPHLLEYMRQNRTFYLTQEEKQRIARTLAERIVEERPRVENKQALIDYLSQKGAPPPEGIENDPAFEKLALMRGVLTELLPYAFGLFIDVEHGRSQRAGGSEEARPFSGANTPNEVAKIRSPYEALVKSFILYFSKGLDAAQMRKLIRHLFTMAEREARERNTSVQEAPSYALLLRLCPDFESIDKLTDAQCTACARSDEAIFFYMRHFVRKNISYWRLNARSNAINFASMFKEARAGTGTPYNDGTYPVEMDVQWDRGTMGEALHILKERVKAVHVLEEQAPREILDEVLGRFFSQDSTFTALIDGGACFKGNGVSNREVAQAMLDRAPSAIQGVAFFERDESGEENLLVLKRNKETEPLDRSSIAPEHRLSYFDQTHGFAADIPQPAGAKGLVTVGEKTALFQLTQQNFRMRGIRHQPVLAAPQYPMLQTVELAMTRPVQAMIAGQDLPTLDAIFSFAARNEAELVTPDHLRAFKNSAHDRVRSIALSKIENQRGDFERMKRTFVEYSDVLVQRVEDDPRKLYGLQYKEIEREELLQKIEAQAYSVLKTKKKFPPLPRHAMPETFTVPVSQRGEFVDLQDDLGREVYVALESEEHEEVEMQVDVEIEQEVKTQFQESRERSPFEEWGAWSDDMLMGRIYFSSPDINEVISKRAVWDGREAVPLYRVHDVLEISHLSAAAPAFDERLWLSNNFLPRRLQHPEEKRIEIGSREQRDLFEVLVTIDKRSGKVVSMGCLSQRDAALWRRKIQTQPDDIEYETLLWDTRLGAVVSSKRKRRTIEDEEFALLEVQLKFLNGDTFYTLKQRAKLKEWLMQHRAHIAALQKAFLDIHNKRGREAYARSDIAALFAELNW